MKKYNLSEIIAFHIANKNISIWQIFVCNPISCFLTFFLIKHKLISPNLITSAGFFIFIISVVLLFNDYLLYSAILYQLSFILDIVDGNVAILKNQKTQLGAFYDSILDWIKPSLFYFSLYLIESNNLFVVITIINFIAAGSWRIRDEIIYKSNNYTKIKKYNFYKKNKLLDFLKKINSIEVEALISVFFLLSHNYFFIYIALLITFKNLILNLISSFLILKNVDKIKK